MSVDRYPKCGTPGTREYDRCVREQSRAKPMQKRAPRRKPRAKPAFT